MARVKPAPRGRGFGAAQHRPEDGDRAPGPSGVDKSGPFPSFPVQDPSNNPVFFIKNGFRDARKIIKKRLSESQFGRLYAVADSTALPRT
jgi:hypothetical protein